jgi:hypothetical protein
VSGRTESQPQPARLIGIDPNRGPHEMERVALLEVVVGHRPHRSLVREVSTRWRSCWAGGRGSRVHAAETHDPQCPPDGCERDAGGCGREMPEASGGRKSTR